MYIIARFYLSRDWWLFNSPRRAHHCGSTSVVSAKSGQLDPLLLRGDIRGHPNYNYGVPFDFHPMCFRSDSKNMYMFGCDTSCVSIAEDRGSTKSAAVIGKDWSSRHQSSGNSPLTVRKSLRRLHVTISSTEHRMHLLWCVISVVLGHLKSAKRKIYFIFSTSQFHSSLEYGFRNAAQGRCTCTLPATILPRSMRREWPRESRWHAGNS